MRVASSRRHRGASGALATAEFGVEVSFNFILDLLLGPERPAAHCHRADDPHNHNRR